jgi:dihydrofolate reductase
MGELIYTAITSLDGYVADREGSFAWAMPDEELHAHVNDGERGIGTYLYGRRLFEVMEVWQTFGAEGSDEPPVIRDYAAIWRAADKVVYSTTLGGVSTPRTRLERTFDPDAVRALKAASSADLAVGGPTLAARALAAGLVDELRVYLHPVVVGGGTPWLPDDVRLDLELVGHHRFGSGAMFLRHRVRH